MADFLRGKIIIAGRYGGSPNVLTRYLVKRVGLDGHGRYLAGKCRRRDRHRHAAIRAGRHWQRRRTADFRGRDGGYLRGAIRRLPRFGDYAYSVIGVKRSTMEQQPETCLRFVRAMMKALKAVQDDHELAARVLELEFPTLTEAGRQAALERAYADSLWSADGIISRQAVDTLMEVVISPAFSTGRTTWMS